MKYIFKEEIQKYFREAHQKHLIDAQDSAVLFCDWSLIKERINRLQKNFPSNTQHCIPVKTNPLSAVLNYLADLPGDLAFEAASFNELLLAKNTGVANHRLVFDSPAKTQTELEYIDRHLPGITINCNDIGEVQEYYHLLKKSRLGLRINPMIDAKADQHFNVSTAASKFGESIFNEEKIIECFKKFPELKGLHIHAASNFTNYNAVVEGIYKVEQLALKINKQVQENRIEFVDIGGGFPAGSNPESPVYIEEYISALKEKCKFLFSEKIQLLTEFGRFVHANACWAVSAVENVKKNSECNIVVNHLGADIFLRAAYTNNTLESRLFIIDKDLNIKNNDSPEKYIIDGPLCFAGDRILQQVSLPEVKRGDHLVFTDIGANTFALWSRHCSRSFPKVIAYSSEKNGVDMRVVKQRESFDDILRFWS